MSQAQKKVGDATAQGKCHWSLSASATPSCTMLTAPLASWHKELPLEALRPTGLVDVRVLPAEC